MKRVLKVIGAVCLGIFIWMILMVCFFQIWKAKTDSMVEELGITATEASSDLADNKVKDDDEENTNLTVNVTGNSFPLKGQEEIYFDSMQEAVNANYLNSDKEYLYQRNLDNVIKEFEIDNYIIVCYNAIKSSREEAFIMSYFKIKEEGAEKKYAYVCSEIQERKHNKKRKNELEELIQNAIMGSKFRMINSIMDEKGFICGTINKNFLEKGENVFNMEIEGQKPDEIIEFESLGDKSYFWYFNDFQSDRSISELKVTFEK